MVKIWHYIKNSGGAREGAGRPRIGVKRSISLTLPEDIWDVIDAEGKPSVVIRDAVLQIFGDRQIDISEAISKARKEGRI